MLVIASDQRERGNPWFSGANAGLLPCFAKATQDVVVTMFLAMTILMTNLYGAGYICGHLWFLK